MLSCAVGVCSNHDHRHRRSNVRNRQEECNVDVVSTRKRLDNLREPEADAVQTNVKSEAQDAEPPYTASSSGIKTR